MLRFVVLAALASGASAIEAVGPSIRSKDGNLIGTLTSPPCGGVVSRIRAAVLDLPFLGVLSSPSSFFHVNNLHVCLNYTVNLQRIFAP